MHGFQAKNQKKSVHIRPIRPIRSSIVSAFSKAEMAAITYNIYFSIRRNRKKGKVTCDFTPNFMP
jgi:hypothetical protein